MKNLLISNFFNKGHERSIIAKKNIVSMMFIKGASILIGLLLIPMTIHYVNSEIYGLWITISSVVTWMSFFDVGLNNGLRNRFAEAKANGNIKLAQKYVSTTYAMLSLIFIVIFFIFLFFNQFINWPFFFNVKTSLAAELSTVMLVITSYFCLKFILSTINIILLADQRPSNASFIGLCENVLSLVIIFILTKITSGSLLSLCVALCVSPLFVILFFNIVLFRGRYKIYAPSFLNVDFSLLPSLFSLGFKFFIIQIAALIQYQTSNIIIMREWGGNDVTGYNISYKYFSILLMVLSIVITPVWSAVTDAYTKNEYSWIKNIVNKYLKFFLLAIFIAIIMLVVSPFIYRLWIGKDVVEIPFTLSCYMMIYILCIMFGSIFVAVLNGIGALKLQFYSSLITPFVFVFLSLLLIKVFHMGVYSILISSIVSNFNGLLVAPLQYYMIFNKHKKGIWIS